MHPLIEGFFHRHYKILVDNAESTVDTIKVVGFLGIFLYPSYYIYWGFIDPQPYESVWIRSFLTFTSILLVFHQKWPSFMKRQLPILWPVIMAIELPFFATFFLLMNDFSINWLIAQPIAFLLITVLMHDILIILSMWVSGMLLGWIAYWINTGLVPPLAEYTSHIPMFLFALGAGYIFYYSQKKSRDDYKHKQMQAMFSTGTNIAHELRTPLLTLKSGFNLVNRYLPDLIKGFKAAKNSHLIQANISDDKITHLENSVTKMGNEINYSNEIINSLLINTNKSLIHSSDFKQTSIHKCIDICLSRFPFKANQRDLVHWVNENDFNFLGSDILMTQIIYNLIRNALYFITKSRKGNITIELKLGKKHNHLIVTDTGSGIQKDEIDKVFNRFYSTTPDGTGVGLAFCKDVMEKFGGDIACTSVYGEFTTFTLTLPKVNT